MGGLRETDTGVETGRAPLGPHKGRGASRRRWQGTSLKERRRGGNSTGRGGQSPPEQRDPEPGLVVSKQDHLPAAWGEGTAQGSQEMGGTLSKMATGHMLPLRLSAARFLGNLPLGQQNRHEVTPTAEFTSHGPAPNTGRLHDPITEIRTPPSPRLGGPSLPELGALRLCQTGVRAGRERQIHYLSCWF